MDSMQIVLHKLLVTEVGAGSVDVGRAYLDYRLWDDRGMPLCRSKSQENACQTDAALSGVAKIILLASR